MSWITIVAVVVLIVIICFVVYDMEEKQKCIKCGHPVFAVQRTDLGTHDLKQPDESPGPAAIYKYRCGHCGHTWEMVKETGD
ncbi:hypothetical protein ACTHGU_13610 [Chitinophagaceae bacterium MMS25-I14]